MVNLHQGLVDSRVLIVITKDEKALLLKQLLHAVNAQVSIAYSLYDALAQAKSSLPHYILSEVSLVDGTIFDLQLRLKELRSLSNSQLLSLNYGRTREEVNQLKELGIIALGYSQLNEVSFKKLWRVLRDRHRGRSPYCIEIPAEAQSCVIKQSGSCLGRLDDSLVVRSNFSGSVAKFEVVLPNREVIECSANRWVNIGEGKTTFNLLPLRSLSGQTAKLTSNLLQFNLSKNQQLPPKQVVYFDEDTASQKVFSRLMAAHDYQVIACTSIRELVTHCARGYNDGSSLVIANTPLDANALGEAIGSKSFSDGHSVFFLMNQKQTGHFNHKTLGEVFSFGDNPSLEDILQILRLKSLSYRELVSSQSASQVDHVGPGVNFCFSGNLVYVDEVGGVVELSSALDVGAKITISGFSGLRLPSEWEMVVQKSLPHVESSRWQVRFLFEKTGMNAAKLWLKLIEAQQK